MLFKGQKIGKYEVLEALGSGGFGSVYLAVDVKISKRVAIKVPHKQGMEEDVLLKEPRMLANLEHPHIVSVFTAEKTKDLFYIVMEYVDGISLEQYIRKNRQVEIRQALDWFLQIGDALAYAHAKNVIHRDIRPANVLITRENKVKVTDFGTSRFLVENQIASTRIGSPPYMAPEHFRGRATLQSDVYSMGVLMYECLAGRLPFFDADPAKMAMLAREGNYQAPHHFNKAIPLELSNAILKAMSPNTAQRFSSVEELTRALNRIRTNQDNPSQDLAMLLEEPGTHTLTSGLTARKETGPMGGLFCWNCGRPISKRSQHCPHCDADLKG